MRNFQDKNHDASELPATAGKGVEGIVQTDANAREAMSDSHSAPKSEAPSGVISEVQPSGERTKTFEAAKLVSGVSSASGLGPASRDAGSFGGGAANAIGQDISATTRSDKPYKSGSRMGKRFDPLTRKLDYVYPEQTEVSIRRSKPLAETAEKQGYRGNYYNQHSITRRCNGGAPAEEEFNRSVDLITMDMCYYADGQYNNARDNFAEYDFTNGSWDRTANSGMGDYVTPTTTIKRGSYIGDTLTVRLNNKGAVQISVTEGLQEGDEHSAEHDLSNRSLDELTSRLSGDAALRSYNQIELDRLTMVDKAGNDSDPGFSPLGDHIVKATAVNTLLRDVEAFAGDNVAVSHRKLSHALAYQVNKALKDGLRITGPMAEMSNGNIEGEYSSAGRTISEALGRDLTFRREAYEKGGAGLFIAMNDSLSKYTTKGKILSFPNSYKLALDICDQNWQPLMCHESLIKDIKHCELFSTIDRPYDPYLPVVATDKLALIHPLPLAATMNSTEITKDTLPSECFVPTIMSYHYENWRNKMTIPVYNYFAAGLLDYFTANAGKLWSIFAKAGTTVNDILTFEIPIQSSLTSVSLWDLVVCASVPYMIRHRQLVMVDVIKYSKDHGYPYTGLVGVSECNADESLNFAFSGREEKLVTRIANPVDAIKVKFPELFWTVHANGYNDDHREDQTRNFEYGYTVLPHYFSDMAFEKSPDGNNKLVLSPENMSTINYPSTRSGCNLRDMDTVYGMTEEDYRLALDRMVVWPGYQKAASTDDANLMGSVSSNILASEWKGDAGHVRESYSYKYGLTSEGIPTIPYIIAAESEEDYDKCLTILDVMQTPRELGLHFVAPSGYLSPVLTAKESLIPNFRDVRSSYLLVSGPGFTAYVWSADGEEMEHYILQPATSRLDANDAYRYSFTTYSNVADIGVNDLGFLFGISRNVRKLSNDHEFHLDSGALDFVPFTKGSFASGAYNADMGIYEDSEVAIDDADFTILSLQKYMWARLQRLPFVVNPFDANASDLSFELGTKKGNCFELYDFMYYHDFCGFRGSDFSELTYARNKARISLGLNYVNDPFTDKTLLLK